MECMCVWLATVLGRTGPSSLSPWKVGRGEVKVWRGRFILAYVSGSSKIQTLSFDSSSIKTEIYSDGKTLRLLKVCFLHLQICRYKTNQCIYYPVGVSHTHLN